MQHLLVSILLILATAPLLWSAESPVGYLISPLQRFDPVSPATNPGASAVATAPALLIMNNRPELLFGYFSAKGTFEDDQAFYVRTKRIGFGTESVHIDGEEGMRRYTLTLANLYGARSALGISYTLHSSTDKELRELNSLDMNFALRPIDSIGLVLTARNLGRTRFRGERINRFYEAGVGASAARGRIGFFLHGRLVEDDSIREGDLYIGGHLYTSKSLLLHGRIDNNREVVTGAEIRFAQFAVGFNYFTNNGEDGGFSYFRMFALR